MISAHELDEAIIKTIILFDLVDYPLTALEIWEYCYRLPERIAFGDFFQQLSGSATVRRLVTHSGGVYYLKDRDSLVATRACRYRISIAKWEKASILLRWLCFIPGVRVGALSSSLAYGNAVPESDIDFFVITNPGMLWQTRVLAVFFAILVGRRPTKRHKADAFCLSFFASINKNLGALQIPDGDPLFAWWVSRIFPIAGDGQSVRDFFACNTWIQDMFRNVLAPSCAPFMRMHPKFGSHGRGVFEQSAKWISKVFGSRALWNEAARREGVVMDDSVLKLHMNDIRKEYKNRFEEKCRALLSESFI